MIDEKTVITCRHCGASIEIDDKHPCPILAAHDFKAMHNSCRASSESESICFFTAPMVEFTSEALEWMADHPGAVPVVRVTVDDLRRQAANDFASDILSKPLTRGMAPTPAPDPYARFRDAIRDGKRVFHRAKASGHMLSVEVPGMSVNDFVRDGIYVDDFFIEGVDIPEQPTQGWLNDRYALTGECRVPRERELWAGVAPSGVPIGPLDGICADPAFQGRRWIVRKRVDQPAERMFGTMAEFTKRHCPIVNEAELSKHAAEHDAIVRDKLFSAIVEALPTERLLCRAANVEKVGDVVQILDPMTWDPAEVAVTNSRPVNLHIGQSATDIVKQARDLVQGMNITKKTKYCAFNIVGSELIWGIK